MFHMSVESYVDSVRPRLAERAKKVRTVVDMLGRIVRNHATFDHASQGSPMETPSVQWDQGRPNEQVWLSLFDQDGKEISQADAEAKESREQAVGSAAFRLMDDNPDRTAFLDVMVMTIEVEPPNVRGYDGNPLTSSQLDGAIADMQRYEVLINGRVGE